LINSSMMIDEIYYKLLKLLAKNPDISQRKLAQHLGVSLGKVNYCLKALIRKELIETHDNKNMFKKRSCSYVITKKGVAEQYDLTSKLFLGKIEEFNKLERELAMLKNELTEMSQYKE